MTTNAPATIGSPDYGPMQSLNKVTAQMGALERAGLKNSEQFRELSAQYSLHADALIKEIVDDNFAEDSAP